MMVTAGPTCWPGSWRTCRSLPGLLAPRRAFGFDRRSFCRYRPGATEGARLPPLRGPVFRYRILGLQAVDHALPGLSPYAGFHFRRPFGRGAASKKTTGRRTAAPTEFELRRQLTPLDDRFTVLRAFDVFGDLDADFVVVGLGGIFLVTSGTKRNAQMWKHENVLWVNGRPDTPGSLKELVSASGRTALHQVAWPHGTKTSTINRLASTASRFIALRV